jgi:hypothetical protein
MENEETLKASALVRELADAVQHQIDDFLANGVVTTSVVVCGIFLSGNQLLRVEKSSVSTSANFVNDSRLEIDKDSTRYVFARTGLGEKVLKESSPPPTDLSEGI